jgi:Leucine-rich repeat (LRR) protein
MNTKKIFYAIRYALVCACLPAATTSIAADITASFADANFLAAVRIALVKGLNDPVADTEAASLASLNVSGKNIANLAGIEHFSSLTYLNCSANRLEELPAALPAGLKTLHCAGNRLNALPASLPGGLEYLNCSSNQLVSLPALPASLQMLGCSGNRLEALPDALQGGLD